MCVVDNNGHFIIFNDKNTKILDASLSFIKKKNLFKLMIPFS